MRTGSDVDWTVLPIPMHKDADDAPYVTAMNIIRDPETGFYNSCHAGTYAVGPRRGLISFVTPHSHIIMNKYRAMGMDKMPIAFVFGVPPAYEIMANFSGLHMDMWGEMEMVGTIMDRDVEMVPCETIDLIGAGAGRDRGRRRSSILARNSRSATSPRPRCITCRIASSCRRSRSPRSPCAATGRSTATTRPARIPTTSRCRGSATRRCSTTG